MAEFGENVRVLFAHTDLGYSPILWGEPHDTINSEIKAVPSYDMGDFIGQSALPKTPGLYLWEGVIRTVFIGLEETPDIVWAGHWRAATTVEVTEFAWGNVAKEPTP